MIVIGNKSYEVLKDHRNGWNPEAFRERYSEVLDRYDYIVGDWGYNQLRLKGFYRDNHPKAPKDATFSSVSDYINEYCNFGCAHFVLQKLKDVKEPKEAKDVKDAKDFKDSKDAKDADAARESRGSAELRPEGEAKGKKEPREPREARESREREGKREARAHRESKEKRSHKEAAKDASKEAETTKA
ncbi:YutD family protein [Paenibacillus cisolokensis]|uniref:YutD family protein n=1 Tax=Paenibacillus cisolokensis TaxID=1658519 RepID=UPI003D284A4A